MTLMAFVGALLGPTRALATVFVGAALGAVTFLAIVYPLAMLRRRRRPAGASADPNDVALGEGDMPLVPFGVFLAPAALAMLLWGDRILALLMPPL
jgi:leader peptidase (prepilin peptidase)/N-methyltransferase